MIKTEIAVIGSGPGGALTSALLAEAGKEVTLLDRGQHLPLSSCVPFSQSEMIQKYRNSGITVAMGKPKVAYVEGSCVGGGSEVNSGLYHRTPADVLERWRNEFQVANLEEASLIPFFKANEKDLKVSFMPSGTLPAASLKLHEGAQALGWNSMEIPRWFRYKSDGSGTKQSMTETMIPRALKAGARLETGIEVDQLSYQSGYWLLKGIDKTQPDKPFELAAKTVFLSSGAIATPLLLRKNGLSKLAGNTLHMHPSIKLVARFADQVNSADMGVPVHQVKEFSPRFSFGCSISSKPYLTLAMLDIPGGQEIVRSHWQHMAIYYSMVTSGVGSIQHTFLGRDPLVKYNLGKQGIADTLDGLWHLGKCLFAAGAVEIYPVVYGSTAIKNLGDLRRFLYELRTEQLNLMTIHLFSSCPMGEDKQKCVTDSYGKVRGAENLYINDASLLCTALGVNPQGTIMAMVRRNIEHFLTEE